MLYLTKQYNLDEQQFVENVLSSGIGVQVLTMEYAEQTQDYIHFFTDATCEEIIIKSI